MLLFEIGVVTDIKDAAKKRDDKKLDDERKARIMGTAKRKYEDKDEVGKKRRGNLSMSGKFRDIARQLKSNNN